MHCNLYIMRINIIMTMPSSMLAPVLTHSLLALLRPCSCETYQILQCLPHKSTGWMRCLHGHNAYMINMRHAQIFLHWAPHTMHAFLLNPHFPWPSCVRSLSQSSALHTYTRSIGICHCHNWETTTRQSCSCTCSCWFACTCCSDVRRARVSCARAV